MDRLRPRCRQRSADHASRAVRSQSLSGGLLSGSRPGSKWLNLARSPVVERAGSLDKDYIAYLSIILHGADHAERDQKLRPGDCNKGLRGLRRAPQSYPALD